MTNRKFLIPLSAALLTLVVACQRNNDGHEPDDTKTTITTATKNASRFAVAAMQSYYLWEAELPTVDINAEADPIAMVERIRYTDDKWTTLTDDMDGMENSFSGVETSFGYSLALYYASQDKSTIIAAVQFVYDSTPAAAADLKRGDIIYSLGGKPITKENYTDLFYAAQIDIQTGRMVTDKDGSKLERDTRTIHMVATKSQHEAVNVVSIIGLNGIQVGYLHYTDFLLTSHAKLNETLSLFKERGIDELVLDLRYNGGGYSVTGQFLASALVPQNVLDSKSVYLKEVWNDYFTRYFSSQGTPTDTHFTTSVSYSDSNNKQVTDHLSANLNLSRLFVLTGSGTASASEAVMVGLAPYMNIIRIGEKTHGKFCGGILVEPSDIYRKPASSLDNWGIYVMIYRFADCFGVSSCVGGFEPQYEVEDDCVENNAALGNPNEPMLNKALQLISGQSAQETRATGASHMGLARVEGAIDRPQAMPQRMVEIAGPKAAKE